MDINELSLQANVKGPLLEAGYTDHQQLREASDDELLAISGIGPAALTTIRAEAGTYAPPAVETVTETPAAAEDVGMPTEAESYEPPVAAPHAVDCAICRRPIEPGQEYKEATYGLVHSQACSSQTYRR